MSRKSPGLALVLSLIWCGIGQIYNGQTIKGIILLIVYAVFVGLSALFVGIPFAFALWIYGMVDALRTAEKINRSLADPEKQHS